MVHAGGYPNPTRIELINSTSEIVVRVQHVLRSTFYIDAVRQHTPSSDATVDDPFFLDAIISAAHARSGIVVIFDRAARRQFDTRQFPIRVVKKAIMAAIRQPHL